MRALARHARFVPRRPADIAAAGLVALAVLVAALAAPHLPARMTVHWTVGDLPYTGVERLARPVALTVLPLIAALTAGLLRGIALLPGVREVVVEIRPLYDALSVGVVATVLLTEVLVILLNI